MKFRWLYCPIFALYVFTAKAQTAQLSDDDNFPHSHYQYFALTCLSGFGVMFPHTVQGAINVSFPYTSTNETTGVTTNNIFQSNTQKVYHSVRPYWNCVEISGGGLRQFFNLNVAVGLYSNWNYSVPESVSLGYGYSWYLNGFKEHEKNVADKRFVFKTSVNVSYLDENSNSLGFIDNTNNTIQALGHTVNSRYSYVPTFLSWFLSDADGKDAAAKNLIVSYAQKEFSLFPKISIANNPFRHASADGKKMSRVSVSWELSLGYNIPLYDKGGISFIQNDGKNTHSTILNSPISLKTQGLTFLYNGKPTVSTPFHFSDLYVSFAYRFTFGSYK